MPPTKARHPFLASPALRTRLASLEAVQQRLQGLPAITVVTAAYRCQADYGACCIPTHQS